MRIFLRISLFCVIVSAGMSAQTLSMVSGNGQVVQEQFLSNMPMVVSAKDASGHPAPGVAVTWKITKGAGTLVRPATTTDANGLAAATFLGTGVPAGESFFASTVTATAGSSSVSFVITTTLTRTQDGGSAAPPLVILVNPPQKNLSLTAPSGSTLAGGVVIRVVAQAGPQTGLPVPNVGVRIANNLNPTGVPPAACNGPNGLILTDNTGTGTCNLLITGGTGAYQLTAVVGEYQNTTPFTLNITPGISCTFTISSNTQSFPAGGGSGTVNVTTPAGCGWAATSNAGFVSIISGASGTGNGTVGFSVAANTGAARNGTLTIAGQTFSISQSSGTPGSLVITTPPNLPQGNVGSTYSIVLSATGGTPPYTWSFTGSLPGGLALDGVHGIIAGTPSSVGTFAFTITVNDSAGGSQSQSFSITINSSSTSGLIITNIAFPNGVVGQLYNQLLTSSGACVTPFSPSPSFRVSAGSLPQGLAVQTNTDLTRSIVGTPTAAGTSNFTLTATDACSNSASASFSITITSSSGPAQMSATPASLTFTVQAGATNIPSDQAVGITSTTSTALNYNAAASTQSGGPWLVIRNSSSGTTPANITVGIGNFTGLSAGQYIGAITISSQASNSPVVVRVTLTVLTAANLTVSPQSFTVTQVGSSGATITRQSIVVNSSPQVNYSATAATQNGGSWLSVDSSTAQGFTPGQVTAVINAAGLAAGMYTGTVSITPVGGSPQIVTITLDILAPAVIVASPVPLSFIYRLGDPAPPAQTLSLSSTGEVLNLTVGVATQSGSDWLSVHPALVNTPANISVTVNPSGLQPDTYQGTLNISASDASVAPLTVQVTMVVTKPAPKVGSITNAASFAPGPVAPGEFVTIFGTSLGPATPVSLEVNSDGTVSTMLGGTQVFFDNLAAPLIYSSTGQVSAIVPYEVARKFQTVLKVEFQGVASTVEMVRVIDSSPGIFFADSTGQGAILNHDGSANSTKNPAAAGSIISIYATGEGLTDPPSADGVINGSHLPLPKPHLPVTVQINGEEAEVTYAGAAPDQVAGMLQVNARIPTDVPKGTSVPVTVTVGPATSQAGVTVAIHP